MSRVPLRVLGNRVLVKPDVETHAPTQLPGSGLYLAPSMASAVTGSDETIAFHRGTVISIGTPRHPLHHEAITLADKLAHDSGQHAHDAALLLRDLVRREPSVHMGDDVIFSSDAGQEVTVDGDVFLILHDNELLAVVKPE